MGIGGINVGGKLIVDGNVTSSNFISWDLNFSGDTLGGGGNIAIDNFIGEFNFGSNAVILSTANLHVFGIVNIQNGVEVTNKGRLGVFGDLDGSDAGSVWLPVRPERLNNTCTPTNRYLKR